MDVCLLDNMLQVIIPMSKCFPGQRTTTLRQPVSFYRLAGQENSKVCLVSRSFSSQSEHYEIPRDRPCHCPLQVHVIKMLTKVTLMYE